MLHPWHLSTRFNRVVIFGTKNHIFANPKSSHEIFSFQCWSPLKVTLKTLLTLHTFSVSAAASALAVLAACGLAIPWLCWGWNWTLIPYIGNQPNKKMSGRQQKWPLIRCQCTRSRLWFSRGSFRASSIAPKETRYRPVRYTISVNIWLASCKKLQRKALQWPHTHPTHGETLSSYQVLYKPLPGEDGVSYTV